MQVLIFAGEYELGLAGAGMIGLASSIRAYGDRVDAIVTQTLYPAICAVRDRKDVLFEAFVKSNRLGLMWGMPFGIALALFADDLVEFVYGDEWEPAVGLIQAFGLTAAINHIGYNWTAFFRARGETKPIGVMGLVGVTDDGLHRHAAPAGRGPRRPYRGHRDRRRDRHRRPALVPVAALPGLPDRRALRARDRAEPSSRGGRARRSERRPSWSARPAWRSPSSRPTRS